MSLPVKVRKRQPHTSINAFILAGMFVLIFVCPVGMVVASFTVLWFNQRPPQPVWPPSTPSAGVQSRDNVTPFTLRHLCEHLQLEYGWRHINTHKQSHTHTHWSALAPAPSTPCGHSSVGDTGVWLGVGAGSDERAECVCTEAWGAGTCWCSPICGYHSGVWWVGGRGSKGGGMR